MAADQVSGKPYSAIWRTVVGLEKVGADEKDKLGILGVGLPVELLALGELAAYVLLADSLASEVERALTDSGGPCALVVPRAAAKRL